MEKQTEWQELEQLKIRARIQVVTQTDQRLGPKIHPPGRGPAKMPRISSGFRRRRIGSLLWAYSVPIYAHVCIAAGMASASEAQLAKYWMPPASPENGGAMRIDVPVP
jgi:hypothetical protein